MSNITDVMSNIWCKHFMEEKHVVVLKVEFKHVNYYESKVLCDYCFSVIRQMYDKIRLAYLEEDMYLGLRKDNVLYVK